MSNRPAPTTSTVHVRGADLVLEQHGSDDAPLMLWGHGLTSSREGEDAKRLFDWRAVSDDGTRLVRYDARGHGRSSATPAAADYRWDELALDQLALLDLLSPGAPAVVGGASMGCATALHGVVRAPHRYRALVLVIPPTAWETRAAQRDIYEKGADFVEHNGMDAWMRASAAAPRPAIFGDDPDLLRVDVRIAPEHLPTVLRGAASSDLPTRTDLAAITAPTLVLSWDTDPGHPVSTGEALAETLQDTTFHVARTIDEVRRWPAMVRAFVAALT